MANAPIQIMNNFGKLKTEFSEDTGLIANDNIELYIQYFNARMNDKAYQVAHGLTQLILNKIDFLPNQIRLEFADMLRTHEVIKEIKTLLKK